MTSENKLHLLSHLEPSATLNKGKFTNSRWGRTQQNCANCVYDKWHLTLRNWSIDELLARAAWITLSRIWCCMVLCRKPRHNGKAKAVCCFAGEAQQVGGDSRWRSCSSKAAEKSSCAFNDRNEILCCRCGNKRSQSHRQPTFILMLLIIYNVFWIFHVTVEGRLAEIKNSYFSVFGTWTV